MKNMRTRVKRYIVTFFLLISILSGTIVVCNSTVASVYAANLPTVDDYGSVVCKKTARVLIPWGYKNCSYSSSNEKVATVNSKGVLKALRLGETKITIKSGSEKTVYEITVVPGKKSDVRLNHEILLSGQKTQLKLVSDKYDTSQVHLNFCSAFSEDEITPKGKCKGITEDWTSEGTVTYWYGSFSGKTTLSVYNPDVFFESMLKNDVEDRLHSDAGVDAGKKYAALASKIVFSYKRNPTLEWARKSGLEFYLDGKRMPEQVVYTPGKHVITIAAGKQKYTTKFNVTYAIKDVFINRDATGYSKENKRVFNAAFAAVDQVILDGMSEEQKVKAIHDYLIYHANYLNNGDFSSAEAWAYGAEGVLLHGEGVCQSYAIAFYMMAKAAGLDCHYVSGLSSKSANGHAWNRVKVDGVWYYIDCTWDDPVGSGAEGYDYYLSQTLWSDHIAEEERDLVRDNKLRWMDYYLTGKGYFDDYFKN